MSPNDCRKFEKKLSNSFYEMYVKKINYQKK